MAFKAKPVVVGATDTLIYECPAGTEAAVLLMFADTGETAITYTVKFYSATLDETFSFGPYSLSDSGEPASRKFDIPLAMEAGDQIYAVASSAATINAFATVTQGNPGPQFTGFTPRGEYAGGTTYAVNDVVFEDGSSYVSRADDNTGNTPSSSPAQWALLASKGDEGDAGDALVAADIDVTVQAYDANTAKTDVAQQYTAGQRSNTTVLSVSSNEIAWTLASGNNFSVELNDDAELQLPGDIATYVGQTGRILIAQDGTGSRAFTVATGFEVLNSDELPEITQTASAVTMLFYDVIASDTIVISLGGVGVAL